MQNDLGEIRQIMVLFSVPLVLLCAVLIGIHLYESRAFAALVAPHALSEAFDRGRGFASVQGGSNAAGALQAIEDMRGRDRAPDQQSETQSPLDAGGGEEAAVSQGQTPEEAGSGGVDTEQELVPAPVGSLLNLGEMDALLTLHNRARTARGVATLSWSPTLEASAQAWADLLADNGCAIAHSESGYGENIFYSMRTGYDLTPRTPQEVMDAFMDEAAYYDRSTNTCRTGEICGHYTQIVWGTTKELGCARNLCLGADRREEVWVCHYAPAGNIEGAPPY